MDYVDAIQELRNFTKIAVTGPQRSGTTFCSNVIASDLGLRHVDEGEIGIFDLQKLADLLNNDDNFVVQCPALSREISSFATLDDLAVVFMMRDISAIEKSERRIGWPGVRQRKIYGIDANESIAAEKYRHWRDEQRSALANPYEINYDSLSNHELWVAPENRTEFGSKQWTL